MSSREGIGLLLIAHGSRRKQANEDLEWLAGRIRETATFRFVQTSYLELTEPNILQGGTLCAQQMVSTVVMMPYFLSPGVHVREDLTEARDQLIAQYPDVKFLLAEPLGRHPLLVEIVQQRIGEATN
ncbi:CbiX/SirB N-terminal domain-containing protein [Telmatocola sphagniphila]|jgi:sirohydrochlorin ferrochelatase|uniref:CbiX/SirB N-terminal domain-containing protein n=1 Tax=Telmatocola sphagniphila TaxID=1123043 RepID=A0A8E6B4W9_9BACT|nr:CbiX/SirB N-terminal domain-containing protein [Telmatocola sphagniphila]QVL30455.1 CbiX/SirB N-terminal domain-containing protein [Telmatocola sphagniphila]